MAFMVCNEFHVFLITSSFYEMGGERGEVIVYLYLKDKCLSVTIKLFCFFIVTVDCMYVEVSFRCARWR